MTEAAESTPAVADLLARARVYVEGSHAKQTLEAYAADWKHFSTWCEEHKRRPLPAAPETIICYLVETADSYRVATLDRRLASITYHHKQARHQLPTKDPEVERTMRSIRRAKGMVRWLNLSRHWIGQISVDREGRCDTKALTQVRAESQHWSPDHARRELSTAPWQGLT